MEENRSVYPAGMSPISGELREKLGLKDDELIVVERLDNRYLLRRARVSAEGAAGTSPVYELGPQLTLDETIRLEKEAFAWAVAEENASDGM